MTQDGSTQLLPSCRLDQLNDKATQKTFEKTGCLLISDFLPLDLLAALKTQAEASFETSTQSGNFVKVGHKRRMITLPIKD
ncbi:hypothetical protein, partial [Planktotalea sp.]|uniref:hypothetical protein n=1 Tax=Planktotalea sp. TaxID=2029877 RepID=UPI0032997FCF